MLSSASRRTDRAAAASLALLLQLAFIAAFLHAFSTQAPPKQLQQELTFFLPLLPRVKPTQQPEAAPRAAAQPVIIEPPLLVPPPAPATPPASAPSTTDLRNFGQALSGCAPETYSNLTPQLKAHCARPGEGVAIQEAPNLMGSRSHVKDEAHWESEWAREQFPALLPCGGFVDVHCLLMKIANGTLGDYVDPQTWPTYAVKQMPKEDFYKVEQAYDAWHKDHPNAQGLAKSIGVHPQ